MSAPAKLFAIYAVLLIMLAFAWPFVPILPIGYLPGDVVTSAGSIPLYLPFGTTFVVSAVVSLGLYALQKF